LNKNIDQVLSHGKGRGLVADGMDIAVFSFDPQTYLLEYSIAKFSQFVVRNGLVINLDTQKYSIGYNFLEADFKKFDTSLLQLVAGDTLYVFSDGFQDQFGGASDRKFKKNNLTKLLVEINHLPMEAQKELLKKKLDVWKGNNIQTDDILILGLRF
jgi:serine phosphatase RsbU (regulator of sigma subunit)